MEFIGFLIIVVIIYVVVGGSRRVSGYGADKNQESPHENYQQPRRQKVAKGGLHCKKCKSLDLTQISDNSKNVRAGGLLIGCLFWPLALLGLNGKKADSYTYRCNNCGNVFRYDLKRKFRQ